MAITHYTELLEDKGLVLAKADAISPHLISVAEVSTCLTFLFTVIVTLMECIVKPMNSPL